MQSKMKWWLPFLVVALLAGGYLGASLREHRDAVAPAAYERSGSVAPSVVAEAFRERRSDVLLETSGRVQRILPDDREGSRHQRFIISIDGTLTVLIAHNIDLAERVPVAVGDSVEVRGEYVWNEKGGVIHWTHRDPAGRHPGGWIRHEGRLYR